MNKNINAICVFASSSNIINKKYFQCAYNLGVEIAKHNYTVVYGASQRGLMGEITTAARINGSDIIGVMPEKLYNCGIHPGECTKFILTKGMRERKAKMDELSQAVIALPGGFGTLEELSEMIVQKQLGYNNKPIVILNFDNFYDKLIEFFENIIKENFAPFEVRDIYFVAKDEREALNYINNYEFIENDFLESKILKQ